MLVFGGLARAQIARIELSRETFLTLQTNAPATHPARAGDVLNHECGSRSILRRERVN
jgi:hypothetical protein